MLFHSCLCLIDEIEMWKHCTFIYINGLTTSKHHQAQCYAEGESLVKELAAYKIAMWMTHPSVNSQV